MIGKNIRYFRTQKRLSLDALAVRLGVSKMALSYYENDKRIPPVDMLRRICEILDISMGKLMSYSEGRLRISHGAYRKGTLTPKEQELFNSQIDFKLEKIFELYDIVSDSYRNDGIETEVPTALRDHDEKATYLRHLLLLSDVGPTGNLINAIENRGFIILMLDIAPESFSGHNCLVNDRYPVIVINKNMVGERQRFTIVHELVHLIYKESNERVTDDISGRFLLPKSDIRRELGDRRDMLLRTEIKNIHTEYGVSDPCIFLRARQERIISENYFKDLMDTVQGNADPTWKERPTMIEQLVCRAYSKGLVTRSKASELLDVPYDEAVRLLA